MDDLTPDAVKDRDEIPQGLSKSARKRLRKKLNRSSNGKRDKTNEAKNSMKKRKVKQDPEKEGRIGKDFVADDSGEIVSITSTSSSTSTQSICVECDDPTEKKGIINNNGTLTEAEKLEKMTAACETILTCVGEDPSREGLLRTPERWAKALLFLTKGYKQKIADVTNDAVFEENHKEMVLVRDIDIHSLCEHHMLPFTGKLHVAYIPDGKIIGLSKIARIAEVYARRLQVQERLTKEIADAVVEAVSPMGVAVVIESSHFCMVMRGVQKTGSSTVTSCVRGCFESNPKTRAEFFSIINRGTRYF